MSGTSSRHRPRTWITWTLDIPFSIASKFSDVSREGGVEESRPQPAMETVVATTELKTKFAARRKRRCEAFTPLFPKRKERLVPSATVRRLPKSALHSLLIGQHLFENLRSGDAGVEHGAFRGSDVGCDLADRLAGENQLDNFPPSIRKRFQESLDKVA